MAYKIGIYLEPYCKIKDFNPNALLIRLFLLALVLYTNLIALFFIIHKHFANSEITECPCNKNGV